MKTSIIVQNLKCNGCAKTIASKLNTIDGISNLEVEVESSKISFDSKNTGHPSLIKDRLRGLGYPPIDSKNGIVTKAVSFVSCAMGKIANHE